MSRSGTLLLLALLVVALGVPVGAVPYYPDAVAYDARQGGETVPIEGIGGVRGGARGPMAASPTLPPALVATWEGAYQWIGGIANNYGAFGGSLGYAVNTWGSAITEGHIPIKLIFSNDTTTLCRTWRRDAGYADGGTGVFPGYAMDMTDPENPRRLNICFVEDNNIVPANLIWDPGSDVSPNWGNREYILLMEDSYDGTGTSYAGTSLTGDAWSLNLEYFWWPILNSGDVLLQVLPAAIDIKEFYVTNLRAIPDDGQLTITWQYAGELVAKGAPEAYEWCLYMDATSPATTQVICLDQSITEYTVTGLTNGVDYYFRVEGIELPDTKFAESAEVTASPGIFYSNMNLLGYWNQLTTYGDCWGYTDNLVTGREYALLCARNHGVVVIDISVNPVQEVSFIPSINPGNDAKDVKIYDHYAIIVKEQEAIQIIDLADVTAPVEIAQIPMFGGSGSHNCMVDGDYLYVVGDHDIGGLIIYDISNPALPDSVGSFEPYYYHDVDIRNDMMAAAGIYGDGIDLIDLSDKTNPSLITTFNYPVSGAHNCEFSEDGQYLFIGDEIGDGRYTRVFDISDVNDIQLVNSYIVNPDAIVHNMYQRDGLLYIGHYSEGVRVWDITDPVTATEVAYYDTFTLPWNGFYGVWSVYPYFASGKVIASDMQTGLYVFEVTVSAGCCVGDKGSILLDEDGNCELADPDQIVDVEDLTDMIDHLFINFTELCCIDEGDIAPVGELDGIVDVIDLTEMIDHLFINFPVLTPCQ